MLGFLKKEIKLLAPIDGECIDLSEVPDQAFAQKLVGDGVAIDPTGDVVVAPCDGIISLIFETNHAFAISTKAGAEILVHIGMDTITLKGEGFIRLKEAGTKVKAGEEIIKIDREFIKSKGLSLDTPVLVTNPDEFKGFEYFTGAEVKAGKDTVFSFK